MGEVISLRVRNRRAACLQVAGQIETPRPPDPIMRRPCADREEKRVTYGRDMPTTRLQCVTVTENSAMPRGRKPQGERALSNAKRQARYRASRPAQPAPVTAADQRRPTDRRSRPQRWRDAVGELIALQAEYAAWLGTLPDSLRDSPTSDALEAIVDLDLTTLADTALPRGYGRD
jgi:hypothetical protein